MSAKSKAGVRPPFLAASACKRACFSACWARSASACAVFALSRSVWAAARCSSSGNPGPFPLPQLPAKLLTVMPITNAAATAAAAANASLFRRIAFWNL